RPSWVKVSGVTWWRPGTESGSLTGARTRDYARRRPRSRTVIATPPGITCGAPRTELTSWAPDRCWPRSSCWPAALTCRWRGRAGEKAGTLGLTERESEVLRLIATGRSNKQIAEALFVSAKTVSVHVSNILAKFGVSSRGEAAATAHRLRLFDSDGAD